MRTNTILGTQSPGERSPDWPARSKRLGIYALVIGVFNIVLSVIRLV